MIDPALWTRLAAANLHLTRQLRDGFHWSDAQIGQALTEYRRFLYLHALSGGPIPAPGALLDAIWRAHRAQGARYNRFCRAQFGRTLHPGGVGAPHQQTAWRNAYRQEFGTSAPTQFWPDPDTGRSTLPAALLALAGLGAAGITGSVWPMILGLGGALLVLPRKARSLRETDLDDDWNLGFITGQAAFWLASRHQDTPDDMADVMDIDDVDEGCFDDMYDDDDLHDDFDSDRA